MARPPSTTDVGPPSNAFDEIVTIKVGSGLDAKTFKVCKGLLSFYSSFFNAALHGRFKEGKTGVVELETEDPATFEQFRYWLYMKQFKRLAVEADVRAFEWGDMTKLWLFGDAHDIPLLQNQVVNLIMAKVQATWLFPTAEVSVVYENTLPGSPLRRFLIDLIGAAITPESFRKTHYDPAVWQQEQLLDLLEASWGMSEPESKQDLARWDLCEYHVHEEGVWCRDGRKAAKEPGERVGRKRRSESWSSNATADSRSTAGGYASLGEIYRSITWGRN